MLWQVEKRSRTGRAAPLGNGMAWFGAAAFLVGMAGEHVDALISGSWPRVVNFGVIVIVGAGSPSVACWTTATSRPGETSLEVT